MKVIEIPGSKSLTNRALIIASLADGKSIITGHSKSIDSLVLINALKKLGIKIELKLSVDPEVLGGLSVTVGSTHYDATYQYKIAQIAQALQQ